MRKSIIKKEKSDKWKKWMPLILVLLMIIPSFIYFGTITKKATVNVRFFIGGMSPVETITIDENITLIQIVTRYNPVIDGETIYCMRNLCIDEGNWTFYVNDQMVNPFEHTLKDGDNIVFEFK